MSSKLLKIGLIVIVLTLAVGIASAQQKFKPDTAGKTSCPCFSQAEVEAIPTPYMQCVVELPGTTYYWSNIIYEQGIAGAEVVVYEDEPGYCSYLDWINDPGSDFVFFNGLKLKEAEACNQIIVSVIESNIDQCEQLFTGGEE